MKYIKKFENKDNNGPQVGDYVICDDNNEFVYDFIINNIGRCINTSESLCSPIYIIQYENVPRDKISYFTFSEFDKNSRPMYINEIIYFSPNREDCEVYLNAKRYNL